MRAQYVLPYDPLLTPSKFHDRYEPLRAVTAVTTPPPRGGSKEAQIPRGYRKDILLLLIGIDRQKDRQLVSGPVPHPPRRFYVAPPPYTRTRGCAPGGSPIGWAVLLLTSTSRARTRRAPRTARALAVQDGLGAWREGGWVGRRCVWSVGCVFRGSSPASCAFPWCAGRGNYRAHQRVARRFS